MTHRQSPLLVSALLLVLLPACTTCVLSESMKQVAGPSAIQCAGGDLNGDPVLGMECMVDAFREGRAFVYQREGAGIDSRIIYGQAGTADGRVYAFTWDSSIFGAGESGPAQIMRTECLNPAIRPLDASEASTWNLPPGTDVIGCDTSTIYTESVCLE